VAQYLIAAQYIHAPPPFADFRRGLLILEKIEANNNGIILNVEKEYRYNLYADMALAYYKLKKWDESRVCMEKVYAIYPTNRKAEEALK
jgi:hypothetical protein